MDKCIDGRFERLEKALSNLIDSVTKYHPSAIQAEELRAADTHLSEGLEQVQTHQNNHLRIQELRQLSASLDTQIRDTLTSLATTRKDILRAANQQNHAAAGRPPSVTQSPVANGASQQISDPSTQQTLASMNTSLPEGMSQFLNPLSGQLFFPWPLEDKIRSGSLASYQILAEQGIDPRNYDPATVEERKRQEEEERRAKEEREKAEREERERQLREEREKARIERERQREKQQEEWRRASIAAGQPDVAGPARANPPPSEKKQFQFTNLDDLDDDDDDDD
ncbi:hypothetical protein HIM_00673 [Hirsutella minnesotensis 3608]|nr:hypothetical protein HIM_00673 [Hirsutella minnesotensis 3608]